MKKALALAFVLLAITAGSAQAITYGELDGNLHPQVGALVGTFTSGTFPFCSGTLVSPTVFVTAAHCADDRLIGVTFDSQFTARSKIHSGTFHEHPSFSRNQDNPNDVAVVVFDKPVRGIAPGRIAPLGLLDQMKADGRLNQSTAFTSVGYGATEDAPPHGDFQFNFPDTRMWATGFFDALGPGYLRISQNPNTGSGGTCYGDSGGPQFLGGPDSNLVVSVTVTGDVFCKSTNVVQRLDVASVQSWLSQFVSLN